MSDFVKDINVPTNDLISRQAAIEHLKKRLYETALNNVTEHPYYEEMADNRVSVWLKEVPSAQPEPLTDKEQRIFLAAMRREEKVCKYKDSLVKTCHEIIRKVKGALWT